MSYESDRRVVLAYQQTKEAIRQRVERYIIERWDNLGSWREADVDAWVAQILPTLDAAKIYAARLTNSYLTSMARLAGVEPSAAELISMEVIRNGVPPEEVYRRGATTLYTGLSEGKSFDKAYRESVYRLQDLVRTDMQLASTHQARLWVRGSGAEGYRRVLSPGENCALCAVAASQRYHKADLMPIHSGCRCSVVPIFGDHDPGQVISTEQYQQLTAAIDEKFGSLGYETRPSDKGGPVPARAIRVQMHGEHGPTLTWRGQEFTGPSDL